MEYLLLLISIFLVCIVINLRYKLQIFESSKQASVVFVTLFVIGVVSDSFAVLRGYWRFSESGNFFVGIKIGVLPLEEYLFMIIIPFLTLTVYFLVKKKTS